MNINELIAIVKKKIESEIVVENISVEDKSFLHKKHSGNDIDRFHLKIQIKSIELKKISKVDFKVFLNLIVKGVQICAKLMTIY